MSLVPHLVPHMMLFYPIIDNVNSDYLIKGIVYFSILKNFFLINGQWGDTEYSIPPNFFPSGFSIHWWLFCLFFWERAHMCVQAGEEQKEWERENLKQGSSHNCEIITWAKIKSEMHNLLSHPGAHLLMILVSIINSVFTKKVIF